ncbi:MAG: asparagine synthase-related protein [Halobacteriota archaeon]
MNNELFGVFGDLETFARHRSTAAFDRVVEGDQITVGVRDLGLGHAGRTSVATDGARGCVLWGEVYLPESTPESLGGGDAMGAPRGDETDVASRTDDDTGVAWRATDPAATVASQRTPTADAERGVTSSNVGRAGPPPRLEYCTPASWLLEAAATDPYGALSALNGSYVAVVDTPEAAFVATDPARTWECFYTDAPGVRVFGTDPAEVARTISNPTLDAAAVLEFLHLGVVLGSATTVRELRRVPFDGRLESDVTEAFDRFVYAPTEFDYAADLADRLHRAFGRRTRLPGHKGLLLSGGYDSRAVLACVPDIASTFTVGDAGSPEAQTAERLARQYGRAHHTLGVASDHLNTQWEEIRYAHGIRESIHMHHASHTSEMAVDTMFHGLLFDTVLRGHFLPWDGFDVLGHTLPRDRLASEFDPAETLVTEKFGYVPVGEVADVDSEVLDRGSDAFVRRALDRELADARRRYDSPYNGTALVGIMNQPSLSFRTHLADHFLESFVAVDAELLQWHLRTPPAHRTTRTFLRALRRLDPDILTHRPPDRPHDSAKLNQIEQFLRSRIPFVDSFENSWPSRRREYDRTNLDDALFSDAPEIHGLPVRLKLRLNDASCWLNTVFSDARLRPTELLSPSPGRPLD